MTVTPALIAADAAAISDKSPAIKRFAQDTAAYLAQVAPQPAPAPTPGPIPSPWVTSWLGDYETGDFSQWKGGVQQAAPGRAAVTSAAPVRQGRFAAHFTVLPGDNVLGGERCEVLTGGALNTTPTHEDWLAFSTLFPAGFVPTPFEDWNHYLQGHSSSEQGQASAFHINSSGHLSLSLWGGPHSSPTHLELPGPLWLPDTWFDHLLHIVWSASAGSAEWFLNGKRMSALVHTPTLYQDDGVYAKQGYYRAPASWPVTVIHDAARRSDSYSEAIGAFPAASWPTSVPA